MVFSDSDEDEAAKRESKQEPVAPKTASKVSVLASQSAACHRESPQPMEREGDGGRLLDRKPSPPPSVSQNVAPDASQGDWREPPRQPPHPSQAGQRANSPLPDRKSKPHPHPYPMYASFPYYDPYGRYPVFPPAPPGVPQYGFHAPPPGAHFGGRSGSRRHSDREREREELARRHDFHPFDHGGPEHRRKWSEEREPRPKLLLKEREWREPLQEAGEKPPTTAAEERTSEATGADSAPLGPQSRVAVGDEAEPERLSPPVPAMRAQPKKIMLRKMSDGSKSDPNEQSEKEAGKASDRASDAKSSEVGETAGEPDLADAAGNVVKPRPTAWKTAERVPGSVAKTLYEPEGKKSEAKFRKYQQDARLSGGGGKRERPGPSPVTTPNEAHPSTPPEAGVREKVSLKRTLSGERNREGKRGRGGEKGGEEDNLKWAEPRRTQRDQQDHSGLPGGRRERSIPPKEVPHNSKVPPRPAREVQESHPLERLPSEGGRQEGRGPGRREKGRGDRRSRGSETEEIGGENRAKPRTGSESEHGRRQREEGPHQRPPRGRDGRTHRLPSREDESRPRDGGRGRDGRDVKNRNPSSSDVGAPPIVSTVVSVSGAAVVSAAIASTTVSTTIATATVAVAPASVPQSVINKSLSVQKTNQPSPFDLPQAPPTHFLQKRSQLEEPSQAGQQQEPPETGPAREVGRGQRRQPQPERRRGGPETGRGGRRGNQRGRGERGSRDDHERQEPKQTPPQPSGHSEAEAAHGRGRGRARERRERRPAPVSEDRKPAQQEGEQGRRGDGGGRPRDRKKRGTRKGDSSAGQADTAERAQRRSRDSGHPPEQRGGGKGPGRERQSKPTPTPTQEGKKVVNLAVGYGSLEDIDSESDWEEGESGGVGERRRGTGEVAVPREPPRGRGRGQRRTQDSRDPPQRSSSRGGGGRGRGRPSALSGRRPGGRPGREDPKTGDCVPKPEPGPAALADEALLEKPANAHKQQEFSKYDLNSSTIAIVDDIRGQPSEVEDAVEFVEVTSKKAQKEKVKKEKEEQLRQSLAADLKDEQRRNRKPLAARYSEQPALLPKPSMTWSSKREDQPNIWSTSSTTGSTDWGSLIRPSTSAPGAGLKEHAPGWVAASASVGVIGDILQSRQASSPPSGQPDHLTASSSYSLFPDFPLSSLLSPGTYTGGSTMLNAAVNMKLSQEHLSSPSGEGPALGGQVGEVKETASARKKDLNLPQRKMVQPPLLENPVPGSTTTSEEPSATHTGGHSNSDLPPRLQASRSGGRGRGSSRGRKVDRGRRTDRKDVVGERKREGHQTRDQGANEKVNTFRATT